MLSPAPGPASVLWLGPVLYTLLTIVNVTTKDQNYEIPPILGDTVTLIWSHLCSCLKSSLCSDKTDWKLENTRCQLNASIAYVLSQYTLLFSPFYLIKILYMLLLSS